MNLHHLVYGFEINEFDAVLHQRNAPSIIGGELSKRIR